MKLRPACAAAFGALAVCGFELFDVLIGVSSVSSSDVGLFRYLFVLAAALWGGCYAGAITDPRAIDTFEAAWWTAFVAYAAAVLTAIISAMAVDAFIEMPRDPLGGTLKLLMILPFGPVISVVTVIFMSWLLAPMAFITVLLVRGRKDADDLDRSPR